MKCLKTSLYLLLTDILYIALKRDVVDIYHTKKLDKPMLTMVYYNHSQRQINERVIIVNRTSYDSLCKAVREYNAINKPNSRGLYGTLMFDRDDRIFWVDEFCDFSHSSYKVYESRKNIINLGRILKTMGFDMTWPIKVRDIAYCVETIQL